MLPGNTPLQKQTTIRDLVRLLGRLGEIWPAAAFDDRSQGPRGGRWEKKKEENKYVVTFS
jgi:hypothetical protein